LAFSCHLHLMPHCHQGLLHLPSKTKRCARGYLHTSPSTLDSKCINLF
jgi:hypothetical protein